MENNYSVYVHTFPNGKKYVGITRQNVYARWGNKGKGYKRQPIYKAIEFFGWENISHDVICKNVSRQYAQSKEKELIEKYNSTNNGYNVAKGGGCGGDNWTLFEYKGKLYNSDEIAFMSKVPNLTGHDITTRVRHHKWSLERAMNTEKIFKNQTFEYNGTLYTANQLANISNVDGITYKDILNRVNKNGWDVERAITQPKNKKKQPKGIGDCIYEYKGKNYNSYELSLLGKEYGIEPKDITNRINHHGWSIEKAISTPKKKINQLFEYNGKKYTSKQLANISKYENITYHDITDRINGCGWSVDKAINTPKRKN